MSTESRSSSAVPLDLSKWRNLPMMLMVVGGLGVAIGLVAGGVKQFTFSWLVAFMFCLSIVLGGWFLVMVHHLFDASWSVPTRRVCCHISLLGGVMAVLFIPILFLAPQLYEWMHKLSDPDHALAAKY